MMQYIVPATGLLFTLENILWINIGVFVGSVFAAIPGLSVILCVILFLPVTYTMTAIPGMMFLLGIYCAGGYGGSVSAILINTPGTPHAAATMLDGHPLSEQGRDQGGPEDCPVRLYLWRRVFRPDAAVPGPPGGQGGCPAGHCGVLYGLCLRSDHHCGCLRQEYHPGPDFRLAWACSSPAWARTP